eukprot:COSAG02_NODE_502_length_21039_cov_62.499045_12_plen_122_part_00
MSRRLWTALFCTLGILYSAMWRSRLFCAGAGMSGASAWQNTKVLAKKNFAIKRGQYCSLTCNCVSWTHHPPFAPADRNRDPDAPCVSAALASVHAPSSGSSSFPWASSRCSPTSRPWTQIP